MHFQCGSIMSNEEKEIEVDIGILKEDIEKLNKATANAIDCMKKLIDALNTIDKDIFHMEGDIKSSDKNVTIQGYAKLDSLLSELQNILDRIRNEFCETYCRDLCSSVEKTDENLRGMVE